MKLTSVRKGFVAGTLTVLLAVPVLAVLVLGGELPCPFECCAHDPTCPASPVTLQAPATDLAKIAPVKHDIRPARSHLSGSGDEVVLNDWHYTLTSGYGGTSTSPH